MSDAASRSLFQRAVAIACLLAATSPRLSCPLPLSSCFRLPASAADSACSRVRSVPCGPVHPWQLGLSSIASLRCPFRPRTGIEDPFLLSRSPIVAALLALVLDPLITLRIKILLLRFHPGFAFLILFVFTQQSGIRHLVVALSGSGSASGWREFRLGYLYKPQKGFVLIRDEFRIRRRGGHAGQIR